MARSSVSVFALLLIALCGCDESSREGTPEAQVESVKDETPRSKMEISGETPGAALEISADQIEGVKGKALQGDLSSTLRLIDHFALGSPDEGQLIYWLRVGVAQNDFTSRLNLAAHLVNGGTREGCAEGEGILREAISRAANSREKERAEKNLKLLHEGLLREECVQFLAP